MYSPRKEYPYEERRLTNSNKFLRSNTYKVPPINLISPRNRVPLNINSLLDEKAELRSTQSQLHKKLSESDILGSTPTSMRDIVSRRPFSRDQSNRSGQGIVIFKKGTFQAQQTTAHSLWSNDLNNIISIFFTLLRFMKIFQPNMKRRIWKKSGEKVDYLKRIDKRF